MTALFRFGPLGLAGALALGVVVAAMAAPGELDPSFGDAGRVLLSPAVESYAAAVAVQPDGKLVLAGTGDDQPLPPPPPPAPNRLLSSNPDFLAVRLTPNGRLDPAFGSGGVVRTPIDLGGQVASDGAHAVAVGADGSIVLGGFTVVPGGTDFAFTRYTSAGALDTSFSVDGIQTVDVGEFDDALGVAVQPDGKVIAVGRGGSGFTVLRLLADGRLDPGFGSSGVVETVLGDAALRDEAAAVLLRSTGKIVVAGTADIPNPFQGAFALVRYLANGTRDSTFGSGGIVVSKHPSDQRALAVAAAPGNKLAVAGLGQARFRVARYQANGSIDRTFGGQGVAVTAFQGLVASGLSVSVQRDGKVVVAGTGLGPDESAFVAARYKDNGGLDPSFSGDGKGVYDIRTVRLYGGGAVIQPGTGAGRLVIAGQVFEESADHFAAVGVDLGALEAFTPPKRCRVPRVIHLRYGLARRKINRAHCSVGRLSSVYRPRFARLVVAQWPRAGKVLRPGGRVNLVLGRR